MKTVEHLKKSKYAALKGWAPSYVSKLLKRGTIVETDAGLIDPEDADRRVAAARVAGAEHVAARHQRNRHAAAGTGERLDPHDSSYESIQRSRAVSEAHRAAILEMDRGEREGALVRVDDVRRAALKAARETRAALMNIPARLGPLLAAESDPVKCIALLEAELRAVCTQLSQSLNQSDGENGPAVR